MALAVNPSPRGGGCRPPHQGKVAAPAGTIGYIASAGLPFPEFGFGIAVLAEVAGGLALIAGYRARVVAGVLAAFCVATAFGFHMNLADQNQFIHFLKNIAMAGGLLQIVAFGAPRRAVALTGTMQE